MHLQQSSRKPLTCNESFFREHCNYLLNVIRYFTLIIMYLNVILTFTLTMTQCWILIVLQYHLFIFDIKSFSLYFMNILIFYHFLFFFSTFFFCLSFSFCYQHFLLFNIFFCSSFFCCLSFSFCYQHFLLFNIFFCLSFYFCYLLSFLLSKVN